MPTPTISKGFPSAAETLKHPAYPTTIWDLEPHQKGRVATARNRGGPINIAWEIHGQGPIKMMLIMGLAGVKSSWQRQTMHFGHDNAEKYSVLLVDNRGIGESDKPLIRYSTSDMAQDLVEVLDHVGWTAPRELHAVGISLGGMIVQELACLIPKRLASLNLLCTAAAMESSKGWVEKLTDQAGFVIPKSLEVSIKETSQRIFPKDWLMAEDCSTLPDLATARCGPAPSKDGSYLRFDNNFQRFQAQELVKRLDPEVFTFKGFFMQLIAAGWHKKSEAQLKVMADIVGRERIAVLHSAEDNMITVDLGKKLIQYIQPGVGDVVEGLGHAPIMTNPPWFNEWLAKRVENGEKLAGRT